MIFVGTVDPVAKTAERVEVENATRAYIPLRLNPLNLDSAVLFSIEPEGGVAAVVDAHAIYQPPEQQHYFSIGPRLLAGAAVLYQFDGTGQSISLDEGLFVTRAVPTWYNSAAEVEAAIDAGEIDRPTLTAGSEVIWQWPEPPPPTIAAGMKERRDAS